MDELIERLENADGPDRELDARVIAAVVGGEARTSEFNGKWCVYVGADPSGRPRTWEPRDNWGTELRRLWLDGYGPTASLDAAMTLIQAPWTLGSLVRAYSPGDDPSPYYTVLVRSDGATGRVESVGGTLPLSACIAALRARGQQT